MPTVDRWSVVILDLDPPVGHEQAGQRRAVVVSYPPFHQSGMATVCPITTRPAKYPGEIAIPKGHAGQTQDGVILIHQVRTIDLRRVTSEVVGGSPQAVTDPAIRRQVRQALAHHLGLDVPTAEDGAA